jgi:hypothetical protein
MRAAMTQAVFNVTYGKNERDSNAFGKCVSQQERVSASSKTSASAACHAEQKDKSFAADHGGKSFAQHYGGTGSSALRACVSRQTKVMLAALSEARVRAAKACWAQQRANARQFKGRWKSFAACVAGDAKIM